MRSIVYREFGGPEVLEMTTVPKPTPQQGEVLVEVEAVGVNPTETYPRAGHVTPALPRTPGADLAGRITAIGPDVTAFDVGDRVFGTGLQNDRQGTYAEYVPARVERLAPLPDDVTFAEGAAIGVVGVTAWLALVEYARVAPDDVVFVHGGSGGVGHVAVQLARLAGGRVVATAGSERARERVREFGAGVVIDYDHADLAAAVDDAVGDRGVDAIVDHRLGEYLQFDIDICAPNGIVVGVGSPMDVCQLEDLWPALTKDVRVQFMSMSNTQNTTEILGRLASLLEDDRLSVAIDREYDLEDASRAHRALEDEHVVGKLLLRP